MTVRLAANADGVTGELYLGNQIVAKYTASAFNLVDNAGATKFSVALASGNTTVAGTLTVATIGAFVASDKYLVVDANGNIHKSATGPAS